VVLDPKLASFFHPWIPTYFVDSLGFMWDKGFFQQFPRLKNIHTYLVQDVFDAYNKLVAKGVKNLYPVGAIIDNCVSLPSDGPDLIFHLRGLFNIFGQARIHNYVEGIVQIAEKLGKDQHSVILTSRRALNAFEILRETKLSVGDLCPMTRHWEGSPRPSRFYFPGVDNFAGAYLPASASSTSTTPKHKPSANHKQSCYTSEIRQVFKCCIIVITSGQCRKE